MTSISVQARIDSDVWAAMKADGETNTQVLRLCIELEKF